MKTGCSGQLTFWKVGKQQVTVDFEGGQVVADAGLLAVRQSDRKLGVLDELARRWPDPRDQAAVTYEAGQVLTQLLYQILAGYSDSNDANALRQDALFKTLLDLSPSDREQTLASGSTLARFQFRANAMRPGLHAVAFAMVGTIRQKVLKVGAQVRTTARRIWFHFSASWPLAGAVPARIAGHERRMLPTSTGRVPVTLSAA